MNMPKISVIMSIYNTRREYIIRAVDSILKQTFDDFEFIIVNDGSEDFVRETIQTFSDKRIKYLENGKNIGLVRSLNRALELSSGEYIARMDSDDISLPQRFERQVEYMDKNPHVGVLGTKCRFIWHKKCPLPPHGSNEPQNK